MPVIISRTSTSRSPWKAWLRVIAAGTAGYAAIVVITSAGFNGWLDGANPYQGDWTLKLAASAVVVAAGLGGGGLAAVIGAPRPIGHAVAVMPFIALDTAYVVFYFEGPTPGWFHLLGGAVLTAAVFGGATIVALAQGRRPSMRSRAMVDP